MLVLLGELSTRAALDELVTLEQTWNDPVHQTRINDLRWRLDPTDVAAREQASSGYADLHLKMPWQEYRQRYHALTGAVLSLPELPDLSAVIGVALQPLDDLVQRCEEQLGRPL